MSSHSEASDATPLKMTDIFLKAVVVKPVKLTDFIKRLLKNVFLVLYTSFMGSSTGSGLYGTVLPQFTI